MKILFLLTFPEQNWQECNLKTVVDSSRHFFVTYKESMGVFLFRQITQKDTHRHTRACTTYTKSKTLDILIVQNESQKLDVTKAIPCF